MIVEEISSVDARTYCDILGRCIKRYGDCMLVRNTGSKSSRLKVGTVSVAKVDATGEFRVRDKAEIWSKFAPGNFTSVYDPLHVADRIGHAEREKTTRGKPTVEVPAIPAGDYTMSIDTSAARDVVEKAVEREHKTKIEEEKESSKMTLSDYLRKQGVPENLISGVSEYRAEHKDTFNDKVRERIPRPSELFQGGALWSTCIAAIMAGKHILLSGGKATGKNTLATSLAFAFQRPMWDISFHSNIGRDEIIGSETFRDGNVVFNPGMAYNCAMYGGFGVLDEINMAKDSAISVLNSILDNRRVIDVAGYERLHLHDCTTFIGTMNYGYAGTRPLNEALVSRFVVPTIPEADVEQLGRLIKSKNKDLDDATVGIFAGVFVDLRKKAQSMEISTAAVDLRGIFDAIDMVRLGVRPLTALITTVANKVFEELERTIVVDTIKTRVPASMSSDIISGKSVVVDMSDVK